MELQHRSHLIFLILSVATETATLDEIDAKRKETPRNISQDSDGSGEDYIVGEPLLLHTLCSPGFLKIKGLEVMKLQHKILLTSINT